MSYNNYHPEIKQEEQRPFLELPLPPPPEPKIKEEAEPKRVIIIDTQNDDSNNFTIDL